MRSFFVATIASFAITAAVCAIAAGTIWLWSQMDIQRAIDLHDLTAAWISA
jgi:hypothetical protein